MTGKGRKTMKNKKLIFIIGSVLLLLVIIAVISVFQYRNAMLNKCRSEISTTLSNLSDLENEVYFDNNHKAEIADIDNRSKEAVSKKDLGALLSLNDDAKKLYEKVKTEIENYNNYYRRLTESIDTANNLKKNYFTKWYDTSKFDGSVQEAEAAISNKSYKEYQSKYEVLTKQIELLNGFIQDSLTSIYNNVTDVTNHEYPFAVKEEELPKTWSFKPMVKQTASFPTWVMTREAEILNEPPIACLFIGPSADYHYTINQIETKEITVQDENRQPQKALVNTEVRFKAKEEFSYEKNIPLNERPAYFIKDKKGRICLVLQNYEGGNDYVIYIPGNP